MPSSLTDEEEEAVEEVEKPKKVAIEEKENDSVEIKDNLKEKNKVSKDHQKDEIDEQSQTGEDSEKTLDDDDDDETKNKTTFEVNEDVNAEFTLDLSEEEEEDKQQQIVDEHHAQNKDANATSDKISKESVQVVEQSDFSMQNRKEPEKQTSSPEVMKPIAIKYPYSESAASGHAEGEVVVESTKSVKEQIANFAHLKIQETHGKPKPGVATAFAPPNPPHYQRIATNSNQTDASLLRNVHPTPFYASNSPQAKPITPRKVEAPFKTTASQQLKAHPSTVNGSETTVNRISVVKRTSVQMPKLKTETKPINYNNSGLVYAEPYVKVASTSQTSKSQPAYIEPEMFSTTTGPSRIVRLRRSAPDASWGFAVFGGTDYGCPPFISRVTLNGIASLHGVEVGDVIVSICDAPVQDKRHEQIKAEILRAGNELDLLIIKQGIDQKVLADKAPQLVRSPSLGPHSRKPSIPGLQPTFYPGVSQTMNPWANNEGTYKCVRTKSLRLLDEHLASLSSQRPKFQPMTVYTTPSYQQTLQITPDFRNDTFSSTKTVRTNQTHTNYHRPSHSQPAAMRYNHLEPTSPIRTNFRSPTQTYTEPMQHYDASMLPNFLPNRCLTQNVPYTNWPQPMEKNYSAYQGSEQKDYSNYTYYGNQKTNNFKPTGSHASTQNFYRNYSQGNPQFGTCAPGSQRYANEERWSTAGSTLKTSSCWM